MNHLLALALAVLGPVGIVPPTENMASAELFVRATGSDVRVAVRIEIERGWYLYHGPTMADLGAAAAQEGVGQPTTIELQGEGITWGDWHFPRPSKHHYDEGFGTPLDVNVHTGEITIWRRGTLAPGAKVEGLKAAIKGLTCEDGPSGVCVPYQETVESAGPGPDAAFAKFPADLAATPAAKPVTPNEAARPPPAAGAGATSGAAVPEEQDGQESSLWLFLGSAVFWGLFTLLMPCTYPMIPITISYFTKQASQRHASTLPLSLAYGAGIVGIFVLIGILVGPIVITFAAHPVTNLVIGALFLLFALTLFGVMNLQPPAFLMGLAGSASQKGGYAGVFFMGATLVITSFTCTAPFVGALLGQGAGQGDIGRIALGMAVFGLTIAVPFVFLSMVPAKVKALPKSGEWMHTLKVWLGFVEVAAALKFLSNADLVWDWNVLSRELFLWLWAGIFALAAAYLFAWIRLKDEYGGEDSGTISPRRLVWGSSTSLFALYCVYGATGGAMDQVMTALIPPYSNVATVDGAAVGSAVDTKARSHVIVEDDFQAAVELAKAEKKLVLINFTGET